MRAESEHPGDLELLVQARENIERYRKAPVQLRLVDAAVDPVADARVRLRMRRHAFLFGVAPFEALADRQPTKRQLPEDLLVHWDAWRSAAVELFNFATLPIYWGGYERDEGVEIHRPPTASTINRRGVKMDLVVR